MKRAGEYLAAIIDADLFKKAKTYSGFFSSWAQICRNCGMAAAAGHSRIRDLEKGILVVEADHPGWVQTLQTKAEGILNQTRRCFPELEIRGVSFALSRAEASPPAPEPPAGPAAGVTATAADYGAATGDAPLAALEPESRPSSPGPRIGPEAWERIEDEDFRDSLKRLERRIREREKFSSKKKGRKT
jgi:hypothetical protein